MTTLLGSYSHTLNGTITMASNIFFQRCADVTVQSFIELPAYSRTGVSRCQQTLTAENAHIERLYSVHTVIPDAPKSTHAAL